MKKTFYIKTAFLSLMSMALLSSCLKDSRYIDFGAVKPLVELPVATAVGPAGGEFQAAAFNIVSTPTPLNLLVNLAAPHPLSTPLVVKLSVDQAALTAYNHANGLDTGGNTPYTLLPAADYSTSLTVTIPANQNSANLVININTSAIDPNGLYILPLTITDAGGQQISNYKTVLFNVQVKNKYDGQYTVTGTMNDVTSATLTGDYPRTVNLITEGAASVAYFDVSTAPITAADMGGGYVHDILSSGSASYYGSFDPEFTFDPTSNNVISVTNLYGQLSGSHMRSALLDVSGVNTLTGTPGTVGSVIKVSYILYQGDIGKNRTFFNEIFTYVGPR